MCGLLLTPVSSPGFSEFFLSEMEQGVWPKGNASDTWFVRRVPNLYKVFLTNIDTKGRDGGGYSPLSLCWMVQWSEGFRASILTGSPSRYYSSNLLWRPCRFDSCIIRFGA